jgi:MoxR-like ATPase
MAGNEKREFKYFELLNMPVLKLSKIKRYIRNDIVDTLTAWKKGFPAKKQSYRIVGPAGVGKTDICGQIAEELAAELGIDFRMIMYKSPVLSRDDFLCPFPNLDVKEIPSFQMLLSDLIPKLNKSGGIILIDEFSRGDHPLQQLFWQIQNEFRIHTYKLPENWFVISTDNPADSEYVMDTLEDAAGLRRQLHMYVDVSAEDFLGYAISKKFHPWVIEYIQTHPERIYDFDSQKQGMIYANPASYEKVSDILIKMEMTRKAVDFDEAEAKISGLLNTNQAGMFISFARDKKDINPRDVFFNYEKVKKDIQKLRAEKNNAKLGELMIAFCTFVMTSLPTYTDKELRNVLEFLLVMPIDTAALFISKIDTYERESKEFKYMTEIHKILLKNDRYRKDFYEPMIKCGTGSHK